MSVPSTEIATPTSDSPVLLSITLPDIFDFVLDVAVLSPVANKLLLTIRTIPTTNMLMNLFMIYFFSKSKPVVLGQYYSNIKLMLTHKSNLYIYSSKTKIYIEISINPLPLGLFWPHFTYQKSFSKKKKLFQFPDEVFRDCKSHRTPSIHE